MSRFGFHRTKGLVLASTILLAACGDDATTTGSGGSGGATASTSDVASSGATGGASSSSSGSGGGAPGCEDVALERCSQLKACAPHVYMQLYENDDALCQSEAARLCGTLPSAIDDTSPGVADPAACIAAIGGSCDAFLKTLDHTPAACQPNPGTKAADEGCVASAQCGAGLACYGEGPPGCTEYCGPVGAAGRPCGTASGPRNDLCDVAHDLACVLDHAGGTDLKCRTVTYGALNDACKPGSDQQCESGLACKSDKCVALLQEGASCTAGMTDKDPCDNRLGLSCLPTDPQNPNAGSTCQAAYVVPDNATCGMVLDGTVMHDHVCGNYSYCDATTKVCKRKAMKGEGCVANGCFPPYECSVGSCADPALVPDPSCAADPTPPLTDLTCGPTPGGIPLDCGTGQYCCMTAPGATTVGEATTSCNASVLCGGAAQGGLSCDDSAQCGSGSVCCFTMNGVGGTGAACRTTAQCQTQKGYEICRTDDPTPCGGGSCQAQSAAPSDWGPYLPSDIGFCNVPTCASPKSSCMANTDCCSGACNLVNHTCT